MLLLVPQKNIQLPKYPLHIHSLFLKESLLVLDTILNLYVVTLDVYFITVYFLIILRLSD